MQDPSPPPIFSPSPQPGLNDPIKPQVTLPVPPPPPPPKPEKTKKGFAGFRSFFSTIFLIGGALLFALFINQYIFQSYEVDGSSMEPTLQHKDRLIIWKLPRTWAGLTNNDYVPKRGDVVVFHKPDGSKEQLIKRVIGLPGEHVVIADGKITIFNPESPGGFNPDSAPYGKDLVDTAGNVDVMVSEGEVFVSGDNRSPGASLDSRSSLGNIDLDLMVGKLVLRLYPFQNFDTF